MNCQTFRAWIEDGAINPPSGINLEDLEVHAASCKDCQGFQTRFLELQRSLQTLSPTPIQQENFIARFMNNVEISAPSGHPARIDHAERFDHAKRFDHAGRSEDYWLNRLRKHIYPLFALGFGAAVVFFMMISGEVPTPLGIRPGVGTEVLTARGMGFIERLGARHELSAIGRERKVQIGDLLVLPAIGWCMLSYANGTAIQVFGQGSFRTGANNTLFTEEFLGELDFQVVNRPVRIILSNVVLGIRGTRLFIKVDAKGDEVRVLTGSVTWRHNEGAARNDSLGGSSGMAAHGILVAGQRKSWSKPAVPLVHGAPHPPPERALVESDPATISPVLEPARQEAAEVSGEAASATVAPAATRAMRATTATTVRTVTTATATTNDQPIGTIDEGF